MKKGALIELIEDRLEKKFDVESATNGAYIELYLALAINQAVSAAYRETLRFEGWPPGSFLHVSQESAIWDEDRRKHYVELPVSVLSMQSDQGIVLLSLLNNEQDRVVMVDQNQLSRMSSRAREMSGIKLGMLEGKKIYIDGLSATESKMKMLLKVRASIESLSPDDEVPIPPNYELWVVDKTAEFYLGKESLPEARLNDNADSQ